ncbi:DUF4126 domain-containing protein [Devosia nitrariae]|uniref:Membrane protein n=1 Tax=Devosia nitrariae TaxID=2071872 RepID=A0ABQ5W0M6_9HYPH|nr:DUF4126 domain-containing protein [Devosia nitrariae]GLQ53532.1 membrane protein [Devosia nitrariae]
MIYAFALLLGAAAGLRTMTASAAVSWAAAIGWIDLSGTWAAFMGATMTPWILTLPAFAELVGDKLPTTPSRKLPTPFTGRLLSGAFSGAVLGLAASEWVGGLVAGAIGAIIGTYGGAEARARLARAFRRDLPAALIEDVVAVVGAILIVMAVA